ncbi:MULTISPECIES: hypothetical protein [unclassified Agarivorans]|uniref:hypothetical protein n=1 Tax=unclassified Agarivorans TaxID=2636026 RepID=UPI0026E33F3D|nr:MULTISPECIES: hypothetical protein [unclassified Agarivorans]MDO6686173.1 hypothetical protein [Agarivorans sp. 3_MG-2023]MDO6716378.1 hypothetical protein [Agarivorans sp. 2_MG-2023]
MKYRLKQNLRLLAPLLALALYLGGAQAEAIKDFEPFNDPFIVVDYDASISRLPLDKQSQALDWREQMLALEYQLDSSELDDNVKAEISFSVLYQRLDQLFYETKTDLVKVNVLESLTSEEQLQALKLWRDIQHSEIALLSNTYNEAEEQKIFEKYAKLDAILASIN